MAKPQKKAEIATLDNNFTQLRALFTNQKSQLEAALAGAMDPDQFIRVALTAWRTGDKRFKECKPASIYASCIQAAQLGLSVDPLLGEGWLVPRWSKHHGCMMMTFQIGYRGYLKRAKLNPNFVSVKPVLVHEGDPFDHDDGTNEMITHQHQMGLSERPKIVGAYAIIRFKEGPPKQHVSPLYEIHESRNRSEAYKKNYGPWVDDYVGMCRVVPLRRILGLESVDEALRAQIQREDIEAATGDVASPEEFIEDAEFTERPETPETIGDLKAQARTD